MLPEDVRNDTSVRVYKRLGTSTDPLNIVEMWERDENGEWQNKSAIARARWQQRLAELEIERLRRAEIRARMSKHKEETVCDE